MVVANGGKAALGLYLDGRVSIVVGPHTHVPNADQRILSNETAFVSDLGMVGTVNSVISSEPGDVLARFLTQLPRRLKVADHEPVRFNSVLVDVDDASGLARDIQRVNRIVDL